ncbi:hypothetical protein [Flagellimonas iocasae]|uniref:Uncharacterized protein n=1 Tax=Flagellimonas iocasae TaxID=2055905 RepID=A0ABW4XUH2_9FLAO
MANTKQNGTNLQESIVSTNEQIRQTIERNITNTQILNEIQAYLPKKKHAFSFVLSNDKKFGVFSWNTGKNDFPIKNIGLYVNNNKVVPTSLYGNPINYDRIYTIQNELGPPSYILGGFEDPSKTPHSYHLSAYLIRGGGIEETQAFPNGESTITLRCDGNDLEKCLKTKNGSLVSDSLYMAIAQQTISIENGEYVFD